MLYDSQILLFHNKDSNKRKMLSGMLFCSNQGWSRERDLLLFETYDFIVASFHRCITMYFDPLNWGISQNINFTKIRSIVVLGCDNYLFENVNRELDLNASYEYKMNHLFEKNQFQDAFYKLITTIEQRSDFNLQKIFSTNFILTDKYQKLLNWGFIDNIIFSVIISQTKY